MFFFILSQRLAAQIQTEMFSGAQTFWLSSIVVVSNLQTKRTSLKAYYNPSDGQKRTKLPVNWRLRRDLIINSNKADLKEKKNQLNKIQSVSLTFFFFFVLLKATLCLKANCDVWLDIYQPYTHILRVCRLHCHACFNKLVSVYRMHCRVAGSDFRALYSAGWLETSNMTVDTEQLCRREDP